MFAECLPGVLEEARFFGIEQLAEQLEVAIKVMSLFLIGRRVHSLERVVSHHNVLPLKTEHTATRGPLSHFPQGVCPFSSGNPHKVGASLSGTVKLK